jgi:hypothetical protein
MSSEQRGYEDLWPRGEWTVTPIDDPANGRTLYHISNGEHREHTPVEQNALVHLIERARDSHLANCLVRGWLKELVEAAHLPLGDLVAAEIEEAVLATRATLPVEDEAPVPMLPAGECRRARRVRRGAGPRRRVGREEG